MLEKYGSEIVCLGIVRNGGRMPLSISQLINIKDEILNNIEGIQLFK